MLDLIHTIGGWFTPDDYMRWTHIEGSLWTLADFFIIFFSIRLANLLRQVVGARCHRASYFILFMTAPAAALLPFAPDGTAFFRLELMVTLPHFLLLLYLAFDLPLALRALSIILDGREELPRSF